MAGKRESARVSEETNKMFERQQRRLNRKGLTQTIGGIGFLIALALALQLTPYRDLPRDILRSAVDFVTSFFSGQDSSEPDPKYW